MKKVKSFYDLDVLKDYVTLIWNDPDPIEGNDYTITWIEDLVYLLDKDPRDAPILIHYGGSEAQVFLHEIFYKL